MNILYKTLAVLLLGVVAVTSLTTPILAQSNQQTDTIELSELQRQWLADHPEIRFTGDPDWLPYESFTAGGEYQGIVSEYLNLIEQRLGLKFIKVPTRTWADSLKRAMAYEVDVISESPGSVIEPLFDFTSPYISSPVVIVGGSGDQFVSDLHDLAGSIIGVVEGYGYVQELERLYPEVTFTKVPTVEDGLERVALGELDVFLATLALASYVINEESLGSAVKIIGKTSVEMHLSLGVRADWQPLVEILNIAINSISVPERQEILARWSGSETAILFDYMLVAQVAGAVFLILAGVLYWNRTMFSEIKKRKYAETHLREVNEKLSQLSTQLSKYLSPQVYESIFKGRQSASISTSRKQLTIFFSDIKDFTATTENLQPEELNYLLNDYFTKMSEIALEYGATIDKYVGDAMIVFFGDPSSEGLEQDAINCVRMAVAMQRRMVDLRAKWIDMGFSRPIHMRIGINTGYCNVGNFGSDLRMDYTVIGAEVNLAARLEALSDPDGILLSAKTYQLVKNHIAASAQAPITVKGIAKPVTPYKVTGIFENLDQDRVYMRTETDRMRLFIDLRKLSDADRIELAEDLEQKARILRHIHDQ